MSTFTYTRLLVPAQYEKEEATMTVAFDDIGDAATAREVAVREVRTALRLSVEPITAEQYAASVKAREAARPTPPPSTASLTPLPGATPGPEKKEEPASPLPGAAASTLLGAPMPSSLAEPSTASNTPSPLLGLPAAVPVTEGGASSLPGSAATATTPAAGSWEWTKPNVRAFCQEAVDRLEKTGGIEAATSKVLDVIGQFAPKAPPLASEIEPDKRAGFIAAIDALR